VREPLILGPADAALTCVLVHGRGQSPTDMAPLVPNLPGVRFVLPKSDGIGWYSARAIDPLTEVTKRELADSLAQLTALIAAQAGPVVLAGFSQGACLAAEYLFSGEPRPLAACLFTGCRVGLPGDGLPRGAMAGLPVYLTGGDTDPWIPLDAFHRLHADLTGAGARVRADLFPGREHEVCSVERTMFRAMLTAIKEGRDALG
jgi:phospholipase/carboxylesterase